LERKIAGFAECQHNVMALRQLRGLGLTAGSTLTANDIEEAFLLICLDAAVLAPEVNVWAPLRRANPPRQLLAQAVSSG
jgi:hypothetical protein